MAVLVQTQMLKLALRVDPRTKAGLEFAAGTIGTVAGNRFTALRLLDIYNEARIALAGALRILAAPEMKASSVQGNVVRKTDLTFTTGAAPLPAGFIEPIVLRDVAGLDISILPGNILALISRNESATIRFVFWEGSNLKSLPGSSVIPDAATYVLWYYGVTDFIITDITGGVVYETYNDDLLPRLLNLAGRIANIQGNYDPQQMAFEELKRG